MDFTGKRIVITGATSGIGLDMARAFLRYKNCHIFAVGRNVNVLAKLAKKYPGRVTPFACDLKDETQVDALLDAILTPAGSWPGRFDIFIADAAMNYYERAVQGSWQHIQDIFAVNVVSPLYCLGQLLERSPAAFQYVLMISGTAVTPLPGYALYSATKAALDGFVRAFHFEQQKKAVLTAVYPVAVKTPFYARKGLNKPVPLFRQNRRGNLEGILRGIARQKAVVYPSPLFAVAVPLMRIFPADRLVQLLEGLRLQRWLEKTKS